MRNCFLATLLSTTLLAAPAPAQTALVTGQPAGTAPVAAYYRDPASEPAVSTDHLVELLRQRVKYVFVLFQENRSFDHYFGTFPGANGIFADASGRARPPSQTPGYLQDYVDTDGSTIHLIPFRIGLEQHAADRDDTDHSHKLMAAKMDVVNGQARMDRFAAVEESKYTPSGQNPPLKARQMAELSMGYMDCDTVPLLWNYASRFVLFDNFFQSTIGPSTPAAIAILAGQVGETQWVKHPDKASANGSTTVPIMNDPIPFWGSAPDKTEGAQRQPANTQRESSGTNGSNVAPNLTFASLPLTLAGSALPQITESDRKGAEDLADVQQDVPFIGKLNHSPLPWGWYEEGYDKEPNEPASAPPGGSHASYIGHHNGAQYFGYITNNPEMSRNLHGLGDFFADIKAQRLPPQGGLFYVRGGYTDITGLKPAFNDGSDEAKAVQARFQGDDDHPGYSDSELSEALVTHAINAIARSPYWNQSAIIITYDESEGDWDHVPPRLLSFDPAGLPLDRGPRIPLLVISPYARAHVISHEEGDHNSVIAFVDALFGLPPLATLPDEAEARTKGEGKEFAGPGGFVQTALGPHDANTPGVGSLLSAFDPGRLDGSVPALPPEYAEVPDRIVDTLPHYGGAGCSAIGIVPMDTALGIHNPIPPGFNPRPLTYPR